MGDGIKLNMTLHTPDNGGGGLVLVFQARAGKHIGYLDPNRNQWLGASGWLDLPFGTSASQLSDGRVVVLDENDLYQNVIAHVTDAGVC